jgi:hypothetical protein
MVPRTRESSRANNLNIGSCPFSTLTPCNVISSRTGNLTRIKEVQLGNYIDTEAC